MTLALYGKSKTRRAALMGGALLAVLVAMVGALGVVTSAFAHATTITATITCESGGSYTINWTIANDWHGTTAHPDGADTLSNIVLTNGSYTTTPDGHISPQPVPEGPGSSNGISTAKSTSPAGTTSTTLSFHNTWTDGFESNSSKTVSLSSACPTVSKVKTDPEISGGFAYWEIRIENAVEDQVYYIADSGVVYVSDGSGTTCSDTDFSDGAVLCNRPSSSGTLTVKVKKALPTLTCEPQTVNNTVTVRKDSSTGVLVGTAGGGSSTEYTVQRDDCATIIVKKVVAGAGAPDVFFGADINDTHGTTSTGDDVHYTGSFKPGSDYTQVVTNIDDGPGDNDDFSVTEQLPTPSTGWAITGWKIVSNGVCNSDTTGFTAGATAYGGALDNIDDGDTVVVCFKNTYTNPNRTVTITKVKQGGPAADTTTFGGTITNHGSGWSQATSGNGSFSTDYSLTSQTHQVDENTPSAPWSRVGYARLSGAHATCPGSAGSYGTAASAAVPADTNNYTVCVLNRSRLIRIIKFTNGGDGSFGGTIGGGPDWSITTQGGSGSQDHYVDTSNSHQVTETPVPANWILDGYLTVPGIQGSCELFDAPTQGPQSLDSSATVPSGTGEWTVCVFNTKKGRLIIHKVDLGGPGTEGFQGNYNGPGANDGTFTGLVPATPQSFWVPEGSYTVQEDVSDANSKNYDFRGAFGTSQCDSPAGPTSLLVPTPPVFEGSTFDVFPGQDTDVYLCNRPFGKIRIIKNDFTLPGDTTRPASWDFTVSPSPYTPSIPLGGGSVDVSPVFFATYTVTEDASHTLAACPALPNSTQQGYYTTASIPADTTISTPGEMITWTFTNTPCPSLQAAPNLSVRKIIDFNGNGAMDGDDYFDNGWAITVTCGAVVMNGTTGANGLGNVLFLGTPNGTCTVAETTKAGYSATVKWSKSDSGANTSGTGSSTTITQDNNDNNAVVFYNQPRVNIHVHKDIVVGNVKSNGNNWTFTLTGCGITPQVKTTAGSGNVDFTDLPPAKGCSYTVTETTQGGWAVSPGPTQNAAPTAGGETANMTFTNTQITGCATDCAPRTVTTTTTPTTPTATPPTPEKPKEPEVTQIAGERTPGALSTPIAPSAGNGGFGGGSSANIVLAILGLMAMSGGFAFLALGRKR